VPAINNHGGFGHWAFLEVTDPWNVKTIITEFLQDPNNDAIMPLFRVKA